MVAPDRISAVAKPAAKLRDLRLDFFRGLALLFIFLNHIPNNVVSWLSNRNYGFSDATETFQQALRFESKVAVAATLQAFERTTTAMVQAFRAYGDLPGNKVLVWITGGVPMLMPLVPQLSRMTTITGAMSIDDRAPGLSVTLDPARPGRAWVREIEGWTSGSGFVAGGDGSIPPIDQVKALGEGTAFFSGPIGERAGLVATGTWRGLSHVAASSSPSSTGDHAGSVSWTHR